MNKAKAEEAKAKEANSKKPTKQVLKEVPQPSNPVIPPTNDQSSTSLLEQPVL